LPPADQQQPCRRHARWGTQLEESRWLHASFATPVAVRNRCSKEGAALEHNRAAGPMKVRLRTGLSTDVRPRACAQRRRSKITRAMMAPPPPRSDSHPPLEGGQAPGGQPQTLADAGGFYGQSPLQAAETTCARNSGNGFSVRRARHSSAETEPPEPPARRCNACGVKRRRRPGIAGAAGGNSGDIGLYPLCLGPLNCPFSKAFVSGFLIFKSP
jgi:hypothetical protein